MAITSARMQMRRGNEADFDPDKMHPGEWAVSTDEKYVRMCFSPGVCVRMATYEAFEEDMEQIISILEEANTVKEAIEEIYKEFQEAELDIEAAENAAILSESYAKGGTGTREDEDIDNAKYYAEKAKEAAENASAIASVEIMTTEKVGIGKPDGETITADEDGTMRVPNLISTTNNVLNNSKEGGLKLISISGDTVQSTDPLPTPDAPQEIKSVVVSKIKVTGKNLLKVTATTQKINGVTFTVNDDGSVTANGTATANAYLTIGNLVPIIGKSYIFSGGAGGSYATYILYWHTNGKENVTTGSELQIDVKDNTTKNNNIGLCVFKDVTVNNVTFYPMIRSADITDDTFEPYHEKSIQLSAPVTLRGIGDVKDVLCKQDGVYGVLRGIFNATYNGGSNETWQKPTSANVYRILNYTVKVPANNNAITGAICSHFTSDAVNNIYNTALDKNGKFGIGISGEIIFRKDDIATLEDWKTWIANNNVNVQGVLITPTFEPLPTADQIALHQLETFDEVTHIFTDSEIEPIIEVEYGTSQVGAYAIKGMNDVEADKILSKINISDTALNRQTLGYAKKNLLKVKTESGESNGITYTADTNSGIITLNGKSTVTSNTYFYLNSEKIYLKAGKYILTGCPAGGKVDGVTYYSSGLGKYNAAGNYIGDAIDFGEGVNFTVTEQEKNEGVYFAHIIGVVGGVTVNGKIFYPMIRSADIIDDTFEPYVDDVDTRLKALTPVNNLLATLPGSPLDAVMGKELSDRIAALEMAIQEITQ